MQKNVYSGKFVVVEGLDGSGQSTQTKLVSDFLTLRRQSPMLVIGDSEPQAPQGLSLSVNPEAGPNACHRGLEGLTKRGFDVVLTKEPTVDSEAGRKIRRILDEKERMVPAGLQELFAQDRRDHLEKLVVPALTRGKIVISDRYFFSTFAYGVADGLDLEWLIGLNSEFLLPDLTFILKVRSEICIQRIKKRGEGIKLFEKEEKLRKVWQTYEALPERFGNIHIVDGEQSIEDVFSQIRDILIPAINIEIKED